MKLNQLYEGKALKPNREMIEFAQEVANEFVDALLEIPLEKVNTNNIRQTAKIKGNYGEYDITVTLTVNNEQDRRAEAITNVEMIKNKTRLIKVYIRPEGGKNPDTDMMSLINNIHDDNESAQLLENMFVEAIEHELVHAFDPANQKFVGPIKSRPDWFDKTYFRDAEELDKPSEVDAYSNQLAKRALELLIKQEKGNPRNIQQRISRMPEGVDFGEYENVIHHFQNNPKHWRKLLNTLYDYYEDWLDLI